MLSDAARRLIEQEIRALRSQAYEVRVRLEYLEFHAQILEDGLSDLDPQLIQLADDGCPIFDPRLEPGFANHLN